MRLESGPLSAVLDAKQVREAAAPFVRMLVRVPEAYALLGPYEATRPGLLVLDADGRRVDAMALKEDTDPAAVGKWLRGALEAPAMEKFRLKVRSGKPEDLVGRLEKSDGVVKAEPGTLGFVRVLARPGALTPESLAALAAEAGARVQVVVPEVVSLRDRDEANLKVAAALLRRIPGVWAVAEGRPLEAWVTDLLLDPAALKMALPAFESDVEERRYALPGVSQGPPAMKIANALEGLQGVLSLRPALAAESLAVVGRKGAVDWAAVQKALRATGIDAKEKD